MRCLIFLIVIFISCNIKHDNNNVISQNKHQDSLVNELIQNDFFVYTNSSNVDSIATFFVKDECIFSPEINRYVHIDAEELAEGSFDFFKINLTEILKKRGLEITFFTTQNFEKSHEVIINKKKFYLFDDKNIADFSFLDIGPRRFFKAINQELQISKSDERFYLLYGGNDLGAILMTDKQFEIIEKINEGNSKEIPYKP